ncbi:MAG: hypothetical protein ACRDP5_24140 [Streptosporangiaceae bacterium]
MTFRNFIPEVWSPVILASLQKKLVYGSSMVTNQDYEGDIQERGDTVHITQFGDPTVTTYVPGGTLTYEQVADAGQTLVISQAKSVSFAINDIDRAQAAGRMQPYLEGRAAYKLADTADQYLAANYTGCAVNNILGSTGAPLTPKPFLGAGTAGLNLADFYVQVLEPLKVILDQNDVPDDDRYITCPPWAVSLISQTQAFVSVTDMQGDPSQTFQRGFMGQVSGFNVLKTNNAPQPVAGGAGTGVWAIQAGHPMALTYAEQIASTEALRLQSDFSDGVRSLHLYGAKLIRPDCIAVAYVERPLGI